MKCQNLPVACGKIWRWKVARFLTSDSEFQDANGLLQKWYIVQEALSEDDDDRPRPSSAVRAKSSTPIAASSRPTTSEVWRYFTKLTNDSVRCNTCKSDVSKTSSGRQSTSPLWDHLKSMHPKTFALTDFCRQRHIKVVSTQKLKAEPKAKVQTISTVTFHHEQG